MPTSWAKIKSRLEWLELGKTVADLFASAGAWKGLSLLLSRIPSLSQESVSTMALFGAALTLFVLIWWQQKSRNVVALQRNQTQGVSVPSNQLLFQEVEKLYKTYNHALMTETEDRVRKSAEAHPPGTDRENFFVRTLAVGLWEYFFEVTWLTIFRSQIRAMEKLNSGPRKIDEVRKYYDEAAITNPQHYSNYSFDAWLKYLFGRELILQNAETIAITERGREFLKYLVQRGLSADSRVL